MKKKAIKLLLVATLTLVPITFTGCFAGWGNQKALKGGYFSNNKGSYVVLNESGGTVMDCWILKDIYVESESNSDGLRFVDENGNGIIVQGDSKIIRINSNTDLNKYVEYHIDTDIVPYNEFYKTHIKNK